MMETPPVSKLKSGKRRYKTKNTLGDNATKQYTMGTLLNWKNWFLLQGIYTTGNPDCVFIYRYLLLRMVQNTLVDDCNNCNDTVKQAYWSLVISTKLKM